MNMLRLWWRAAIHQPFVSIVLILTIALGVGTGTALFSYLSIFVWPGIDAPDPSRVANLYLGTLDDPRQPGTLTEYQAIQEAKIIHAVAANTPFAVTLETRAGNNFTWGQVVSGNFFHFFGATAVAGRLIGAVDDKPEATPVVVLSHHIWLRHFNGDPNAVGTTLRLNGHEFVIAGVCRQGFVGAGYASNIFVPLSHLDKATGLEQSVIADLRRLRLWGRIAQDDTWESAQSRLTAFGKALDISFPREEGSRKTLLLPAAQFDPETKQDQTYQTARFLTVASVLFILLGTGNIAGLFVAQAVGRQREWALRKALGASPVRLASGILAQMCIPAIIGCALSFPVAVLLMEWLEKMLFTPLAGIGAAWGEGIETIKIGKPALIFSLAATAFTVLLSAIPPIVRLLKQDPMATIKQGTGTGTDSGSLLSRNTLVVIQIALAFTLLASGSLLIRSLLDALHADAGVKPDGVAMMAVHIPRSAIVQSNPTPVYSRIVEEVENIPGVLDATVAEVPPFSGWIRKATVATPESPNSTLDVAYNIIGPKFFDTLGIPLIRGRSINAGDRVNAQAVIVVNRLFAEKLWGNSDPLGRRVLFKVPDEAGPEFEVVGVVGNATISSYLEPPEPMIFFATEQKRHARRTILVKSNEPLAALEPKLRKAVENTHAVTSIIDLLPLTEQKSRSLSQYQMNASVASWLAVGGLLIALGGLGALQFYMANLRRREIAVRMCLGATHRNVIRQFVRSGIRLILFGTVLGLGATFAIDRLFRSVVIGLRPHDPVVLIALSLAIFILSVATCIVPAMRSTRLPVASVLRDA